ncbi:MAG: histidine phosphatase family protein [Paracoccus sp. (in: a-proteobacteria)]|uniref:histidine phosphatase family protein n=1 Tax=Paracoccus sp. TaxID=267 RepID=UPI0039E5176B
MTSRITLICAAAPPPGVFPDDQPACARALAALAPLRTARDCVSAPALRAMQTARALGLDPRPEPALREADFGAWAGLSMDRILAVDAAGLAAWTSDPKAAPHGGESFAQMRRRVAAWLDARAGAGQSLIALTHPGPIQAALLHVLDAPSTSARRVGVRPFSRLHLSHDGGSWTARLGRD